MKPLLMQEFLGLTCSWLVMLLVCVGLEDMFKRFVQPEIIFIFHAADIFMTIYSFLEKDLTRRRDVLFQDENLQT